MFNSCEMVELRCAYDWLDVSFLSVLHEINGSIALELEGSVLSLTHYNDESYLEYFSTKPNENIPTKPAVVDYNYNYKSSKIVREQNRNFLSKALYYEFVENK